MRTRARKHIEPKAAGEADPSVSADNFERDINEDRVPQAIEGIIIDSMVKHGHARSDANVYLVMHMLVHVAFCMGGGGKRGLKCPLSVGAVLHDHVNHLVRQRHPFRCQEGSHPVDLCASRVTSFVAQHPGATTDQILGISVEDIGCSEKMLGAAILYAVDAGSLMVKATKNRPDKFYLAIKQKSKTARKGSRK